jgi:type II secretory pathway component GspD/PulD (secretin)
MLRKTLLLVAVIGIATALVAADTDTVSRAFELEHASVLEVSAAVQPLLSEFGSLTVQPKLSRIVVQDRSDVMKRVTTLIEELDRVPGLYSVQIELLEGTEPKPYGTQDEIEANAQLR